MSIEAIKKAQRAYADAVDAVIATQEGDDPHAAALAIQGVERAQEVWKTWTQPEYIGPLIERLEAAEKDAARYAWLCETYEWPENVRAAFDTTLHKHIIDADIDSAMAANTQQSA